MPAARAAAGRLAADRRGRGDPGRRGRRRRRPRADRCGSAAPADPAARSATWWPSGADGRHCADLAGVRRRRRRARAAGPTRWSTKRRSARAVSIRCTPGMASTCSVIRHRSSASRATTCTSRSATPDSPITSSTSGMSRQAAADLGEAALHHLHGHVGAEPVAERLGPHPAVERRERAVALQPGQPGLHGVARQPEPLRQRHDAGPRVLGQGEQEPGVGGVHIGHVAQSDMRGRPTTGPSAQSVRGILRRSVPGWCCPTTGWSCHHV